MVLGEIRFVQLKHIEGIHNISLNGYLKRTVKDQLRNAVCSIAKLEDRVTMQKVYQILFQIQMRQQSRQVNTIYLQWLMSLQL